MGMIKGGALVIVSVLFMCALVIAALFWTISLSLEYDVVEEELLEVVRTVASEQTDFQAGINSNMGMMQSHCLNASEYVYADDSFGETFVIPCEVIANGSEAVIDYNVKSLVEKAYYAEYECEGWIVGCAQELDSPFVLVSDFSHDYFRDKFSFLLIVSFVLLGLMFFLAESKSGFFVLAGFLIILCSLPFAKLEWLLSFLDDSFLDMFTVFFSQATSVFWRLLVAGILFLVVGIAMKMMGVGFKVSALFNKNKAVAKPVPAPKEVKVEKITATKK